MGLLLLDAFVPLAFFSAVRARKSFASRALISCATASKGRRMLLAPFQEKLLFLLSDMA